jgi:hypothetical protein
MQSLNTIRVTKIKELKKYKTIESKNREQLRKLLSSNHKSDITISTLDSPHAKQYQQVYLMI